MNKDIFPPTGGALVDINERSREIFRRIVESYLATGEPVGSRNLSRILPMSLSPASVRNVMADLEGAGLIYAPHTSAGRLPTETGPALLRRCADGGRRRLGRGALPHRGGGEGVRPEQDDRGHPLRSLGPAVRPVARRRRRRDDQGLDQAQAYRVRPARPDPGARSCWWRRTARSKIASSNCRRACRLRRSSRPPTISRPASEARPSPISPARSRASAAAPNPSSMR